MNENNKREKENVNTILFGIQVVLIILYFIVLFFSKAKSTLALILMIIFSSQIEIIRLIKFLLIYIEEGLNDEVDKLVDEMIFFAIFVYPIIKIL